MVLDKDRLVTSIFAEPVSSKLSDSFKLKIELNTQTKVQPQKCKVVYKVDSINSASPVIDLATDIEIQTKNMLDLTIQTRSIEKELAQLENHQVLNIGQIDLVTESKEVLSSLVVHVKKDL